MKPIIAGNWKLNCTIAEGKALAKDVAAHKADNATVIVSPPFTAIHTAKETGLKISGQDCSAHESGAHTGEISAHMLKDAGCQYVIVGHSERRTNHNESSKLVQQKAAAALKAGLTPIICIGETLEQREQGVTLDILTQQIKESLPQDVASKVIVAYEPVWAIGTGKVASIEDINEAHNHLRSLTSKETPLLYGGSVKPDNAKEILSIENVNGALVGGASLKAESFLGIVKAA